MPLAVSSKSRPLPVKGKMSAFMRYGEVETAVGAQSQSSFSVKGRLDPSELRGEQVTVSENHPGWRKRRKDAPFNGDVGGNFDMRRRFVESLSGSSSLSGRVYSSLTRYAYANYNGVFWPCSPSSMSFPPYAKSSDQALNAYGATAIARCKPTNPVADASTFLGELLHDGIPKMIGSTLHWKDATRTAKSAGGEYLNAQFGWLPLVSDVRSFAEAIASANVRLDQYERDAGKLVRRRYSFPPEETYGETVISSSANPFVLMDASSLYVQPIRSPGKVVRYSRQVKNRWFSGAFTYALPSGYDSRNAMDRAALMAEKVFGLELTPETLWNLTPWSWAADWISNAGDVIDNLTSWSKDGLVLRYGYICEHTRSEYIYTFSGRTGYQSGQTPSPMVLVSETKVRRRATPFGFGFNWSSFTPRQWSILAALGITKS